MPKKEKTPQERLEGNTKWWAERQEKAQAKLYDKSAAEIEKQLEKYYKQTMSNTIGQFEATYYKILSTLEDGKEATPADLYKLDTYWQQQAQLTAELEKLGNKEAKLLSKSFMEHYMNVYEELALKDGVFFGEIDSNAAKQVINQIWCADGKSWSSRIWTNTSKLQAALNEKMVDCIITGRNPRYLKEALMKEFGVAYRRADTLVRTELSHIQNEAARNRYRDSGITEVEVLADWDSKRCEICADLHHQIYPINAKLPIPAHPNCRCCIIPVINTNHINEQINIDLWG